MKDKYFLYVGNAYPHKNIELLLRAADAAGVRVVFVGKGDFFYKRLGIQPKTVTDAELWNLYQNAQAFVFPSFMEGFGLPALEALANNCPVIASDIPVFHEILGSSATYFDPYRVDDLARILKSAAKKRLPVDSGILKNYSWQKMAKETLSVYENCIGLRSRQ
ncbi:MAG: glycosyltransferase family 1 protein [Candidatus Gottesmanbacteria bacterium]|nr:glycosyltransferase family 1 protein [Candidatus Gottesmanbacteria bacterium]